MNNRGMVKWAPFNSVINGNDVIKELNYENSKIKKPSLSEEQIYEYENIIIESYTDHSEVNIIYYDNQYAHKLSGKITKLDNITKKIVLNNQFPVYFFNIIKISKKNY